MKKSMIKVNALQMVLLGTAITLFSSCLKNQGPNYNFENTKPLVSFQYSGAGAEPFLTSIFGTPEDSTVLEVTLSVSSLTLGTAVTATITPDAASLDAYNTDNGADYVQLPSSMYTIENGGAVTINPGEQIVGISIKFKGDQIDYDISNGLALKLTDATGATIATNLNTAILLISLRNPYEGDYACTGYFVHPSSPRAIDQTTAIQTVSPIRSQTQLGDLAFYFRFDTDPVTGVLSNWEAIGALLDTYTASGSGFLYTDNAAGNGTYPGPPYVSTTYNNTYDFATQTFWMHYGYNGVPGTYTREVFEEYQRQ